MKKSIIWIDLLRIVSAFAVVWLHVSSLLVIRDRNADPVSWWVANFADSASRWCVPVFFMISGFLVLPRASEVPLSVYYKTRLSRLIAPLVFWSVFYLLLKFFYFRNMSAWHVVRDILVGRPFYHLWFLYALMGLTIFAPFLGRFARNSTRQELMVSMALLFLVSSCYRMLESLKGREDDIFAMWAPFVAYYLAGDYFQAHEPEPRLGALASVLCFTASVVAIALGVGYLSRLHLQGVGDYLSRMDVSGKMVMYDYLNPFVIVCSLIIFSSFRAAEPRLERLGRASGAIRMVSPLMLGVYVIHPLFIRLYQDLGMQPLLEVPLAGILLFSVAVFVSSLLGSYLLSLIPGCSRLVR